jgi:ribosomal protein L37AE/L43A
VRKHEEANSMRGTMDYTKEDQRQLEDAQAQLERYGVGRFQTMRGTCEDCGNPAVGVRFTTDHWHCAECGDTRAKPVMGIAPAIAIGALAGAGVIGLAWWMANRGRNGGTSWDGGMSDSGEEETDKRSSLKLGGSGK